jgi:hypothetical protein
VRTNPKSGGSRSTTVVPRRRTVRPKGSESVALTAVSEESVSVQDVTQAEIAQLAYFLWEARGGNGGSAEEDWYRAEQEILARSKA